MPNDRDEPRDSIGRRRRPGQTRGLRPLHPLLKLGHVSRSIRVAMSAPGWAALDRAATTSQERTKPRAIGLLIERALGTAGPDWQEWQIRKEKQLLERAS